MTMFRHAKAAVLLTAGAWALQAPLYAQTPYYWDTNGSSQGSNDGSAEPAFTWNDTDAWWSTSADGVAETVAWVSGSLAVFGAGTNDPGTVAVDGFLGVGGLKFEDGTVTLRGGLLNFTQNATIEVADARTATLDGVGLFGAYSVTKTSRGKLILTGDAPVSFSGGLTLRGGTVEVGMTSATATGTGNILLEAVGGISSAHNPVVLRLLADNQISDSAVVSVISRQYNGSLLDLNGHQETIGGLVLKSFTGTNDIGVKTGAGGVLTVLGDIFLHNNRVGSEASPNNVRDVVISGTGNRGVLAPDSGILDLGGGVRTITVASEAPSPVAPNSDATIETTLRNGGIIKAGAQGLILTGTNTYTGGTTILEGTLRVGAGGTSGSIMGDVVNQSVLEFSRSNAAAYAGNITGAGALHKTGAGIMELTGVNSYSGLTSVKNGFLQVGQIGMAGQSTGTNLGTQGVIELGDGAASTGLLYIGAGESTDKVLRLTGTTGTVTIGSSGSGALVLQSALQFVGLGARTVTLTGTHTGANTLKQGVANATDGATTSLLKTGAGTWVLEGGNTYSGTTTINGGLLRLAAGATLATTGVRVQDGTWEVSGGEDVSLPGDAAMTLTAGEATQSFFYSLILGGGGTGSSAAVVLEDDRVLHLGAHVGFAASGNNLAAVISGGSLHLGDALRVFVVGNSSNADPDLTVSSVLTGTTGATLMKAGAGRMVLTRDLQVKSLVVNAGRLDLQGEEYAVSGSLRVGLNSSGSLFYATAGGTLTVGGGSGDVLDVGVVDNVQTYSYASNIGVMNLRGTEQFSVNVGRVRLGVHTSTGSSDGVPQQPSFDGVATPVSMSPSSTEVYLASSNRFTASTSFVLADAASASVGGVHKLEFGEGQNVVHSPLVYFGYRKGSGQAWIRGGGTLEIKGVGDGARAALYIGYNAVNTGAGVTSYLDMTQGSLQASLSSLIIGWKSGGSGGTAGSSTGTLTLGTSGANAVNVSGNVVIGYIAGIQSTATSFGSGTLNVGGGTFDVGGNVELATVAPTGAGATNTSLTAAGLLRLSGGVFTVQGNILHLDDALNRGSATVSLEGGTLDLTGGSIGEAGARAVTLLAGSGTLRALGELNAGGTLTKSTSGVLRLEGANTHTGATLVTAGTLLVDGSHLGGGAYTVSAGATLGGAGMIAPAAGQHVVVHGSLVVGDPAGATPATLTVTTSGGGALVLENGSVVGLDLISSGSGGLNQADQLIIHGVLEIAGTVTLELGNPNALANWTVGDRWKLFDWAGLAAGAPAPGAFELGASFSTLLAGSGQQWDLSDLYTGGTIAIAPEPGRSVLLLLGLLTLAGWRRRW